MRVEYRHAGGGKARARVKIKPLGKLGKNLFQTPDGEQGLRAAYFHSPDLKGEPAKTKTVPDISFFKFRAPGRKGDDNPKNFGIRWSGRFGPAPQDDNITFT